MAKKLSETDQVRQDIANLCTTIGDRSFVIREAQNQITTAHEQIDELRKKLRELEGADGSKNVK